MTDALARFRNIAAALFCLLALPVLAHAQTSGLQAGFAPGSIWLSRSNVVAGDTVNINAVLYNSSENPLSGDLIYYIDGVSIGIKKFTLAAEESKIISTSWTAKAGAHSISARIGNTLNTTANVLAAVQNQTTGDIKVIIADPPAPSPAVQALNTVTSAIQNGVMSGVPAVMGIANTLLDATEAIREDAKSALEKRLATSSDANPARPENGVEKNAVSSGTATGGETSTLSKAVRAMAAAGLVVVSSKTLFYFSLALVLLLLIQILRVSMRDRKHKNRRPSED
jgi:hypothetical protein